MVAAANSVASTSNNGRGSEKNPRMACLCGIIDLTVDRCRANVD
jgi:hypothetical protein